MCVSSAVQQQPSPAQHSTAAKGRLGEVGTALRGLAAPIGVAEAGPQGSYWPSPLAEPAQWFCLQGMLLPSPPIMSCSYCSGRREVCGGYSSMRDIDHHCTST